MRIVVMFEGERWGVGERNEKDGKKKN